MKLRVVGAISGHLLNDFLRIGPNLQEDLFDIIMRQYKLRISSGHHQNVLSSRSNLRTSQIPTHLVEQR